jgi:uncharacterized protein (DUF1697 family)
MTRYVAFLRGINVGGRKLIKMDALAEMFRSAGLKNVRTHIASGNVIFDSASANKAALIRKIEKVLVRELGYEVPVILRTLAELENLARRNPFKKQPSSKDIGHFVVFLAGEPEKEIQIPLISQTENLEVFELADSTAFILARRKKTGWFGYPNNFVEKQFGVIGTTRNWSSVNKLVKAARD